MSKKHVFLLCTLCTLCSYSWASKPNAELTFEESKKITPFMSLPFEEQLAHLKAAFLGRPEILIKLIIGPYNQQRDQNTKQPGVKRIFLYDAPASFVAVGFLYLAANYNDLAFWRQISGTFKRSLQSIEVEAFTHMNSKWSINHIYHMASMLKKIQGEFILSVGREYYAICYDDVQDGRPDEILDHMIKVNQRRINKARERLPTKFIQPWFIANEEDKYTDEVNQYIERMAPLFKRAQTKPKPKKKELMDMADQLRLNLSTTEIKYIRYGEDFLRDHLGSNLKREKVTLRYFNECFLPAIASVFREYFINVSIEPAGPSDEEGRIRAKGPLLQISRNK